jgi:hypothetical protein
MINTKSFWINNIKISVLLLILACIFKNQLELKNHKIEAEYFYNLHIISSEYLI